MHVVTTRVWVEVSEEKSTGLVTGFADYPSLTTVELERIGVVVVVPKRKKDSLLSDEDVACNKSRWRCTKRQLPG